MSDTRKECCKQPANRVVIERRPSVIVEQCQACQCKHYEFTVDPIVLGVDGAQLGGG